MMDFTSKPTNSTQELTKDKALIIYDKIKLHGNADLALKGQTDSKYEPEHFVIVDKEIDRLFNRIQFVLSGKLKIKDAEYGAKPSGETYIIKEAEYYKPDSMENFLTHLDSELLEVETVLNDYISYNGYESFNDMIINE